MFAVIMAGGKGTRLTSITKNEIPKAMVQIGGKPILQWQIEQLQEQDIKDIVIVIGHLGKAIMDYFGDGEKFGVHIQYILEHTPRGTAGSLASIPNLGNDFILLLGDILFNVDLNRMFSFHKVNKAECTLFVHPNNHPYDSNIIILKNDKVINILDKKEKNDNWYPNCVSAGIYIFQTKVCEQLPDKVLDLEKDVIQSLILKNTVYGYISSEYVKDIGTEKRFHEAEQDLALNLPKKRSLKQKQKAIFLDRDGTINQEVGLISDLSQLELEPRAIEAIKRINNSEYLAIIITNQPVIAKGMCSLADLQLIHYKLETLLGAGGAFVNAIYYCPHHPQSGFIGENIAYKIKCNCRKPGTELFTRAAAQFNIDLTESWMIGDRIVDIQAGQAAGTKTILLHNDIPEVSPTYKTNDLYDAVNLILGE